MSPASGRPSTAVPLLVTVGLLAARATAVAPLVDPVHGAVPDGLHLATPWLYTLFAPLFTLWDGVSMLGMSRLRGWLTGCALLYLGWRVVRGVRRGTSWRREVAVLAAAGVGFVAFVVTGALWHRPMLRLAGAAPDAVVVDYHSHTNRSRDVRKTLMRDFDVAASRRWHARAGFDVFFVTDHNEVHRPADLRGEPPTACPGVEISAAGAHIVLLGPTTPIPREHARSLDGLLTLLRISDSAYGGLSIASLPEYERAHWDHLASFVASGLDGFEIVNASPKASELPRVRRDTVIALAQRAGRGRVGVSDSHGWGATNMVWNLVHLPGWRDHAAVCDAILGRLRTDPEHSRVIERARLQAETWWPLWLTPIGVVWETWRGMGWLLTVSWLLWIWAGYLSCAFHLRNPDAPHPFSRHRLRRTAPRGHER